MLKPDRVESGMTSTKMFDYAGQPGERRNLSVSLPIRSKDLIPCRRNRTNITRVGEHALLYSRKDEGRCCMALERMSRVKNIVSIVV